MLHAPWTLPLPTTRAASSLSRRAVASRAHKLLVATLQCQCNCHFKPLLQTSTQIWLKRCPVATPLVFHLSASQFTTTYHSIPNLNHPNLSDGEGSGRGECGDGEDGVAERAARESERGRQRREGSGGGGDGAEGERGGRQSRAAERAAWRAVALGGEGAAGEVRLPQADGSNGAEEKRKRRQKRLSFSLELIEHYGKKSLFCKRPPNPFYAGPGTQLEPDLCSGKTKRDFILFLAALNSVRAGLPRWPMRCIRPWSPE